MKLRWDNWMALIDSWSSLRENVESYGKEKSPGEVWPYFEVFTFFCFSCCKLYYFVVLPNLYFHSFCSIVLFFRLISCSRNASVFISHSHKKTVDCSWSLVCRCWSVHICRLWSVSHNAGHQRKRLVLKGDHHASRCQHLCASVVPSCSFASMPWWQIQLLLQDNKILNAWLKWTNLVKQATLTTKQTLYFITCIELQYIKYAQNQELLN